MSLHVVPLSGDISILNAVIDEPPVFVAGVHESAIELLPDGDAVKAVGASGTVAGVPVVEASEPLPAAVTTLIWKKYVAPLVSPVTTSLVAPAPTEASDVHVLPLIDWAIW